MTYLPPTDASVNTFTTIVQFLSYMQKLCLEANTPYANVTLHLGAAMNAYKVIWNCQNKFANFVIHLGDFHFMKEGFNCVGKLIEGSEFDDIVFQSGMFMSDSMNSVISGSHYNRCWKVHEHFDEAMERLLFERFVQERGHDLPQAFADGEINDAISGRIDCLVNDMAVKNLWHQYELFKGGKL